MGRRRRRRKVRLIYTRLTFLVVLILILIFAVKNSQAKYVSEAQSNVDVNLAYYVFTDQSISQNLKLENILPRSSAYPYSFSVANYDANDRTKTFIDYDITILVTTNLQLDFSIHKRGSNTSEIATDTFIQDSDGTYYRRITLNGGTFGFTQNQMDVYDMDVTFPERFNQAEYEGIIEYIKITVDARQKM